jgi:D-alanyl-D-alanine carboxypeptidase
MTGPIYRHRPSAQEYRLRRAGAATLLILLLFVGYQAAGGGKGHRSAAATTTTSSTTTTAAPKTPACTTGDVPTQQDPKQAWATVLVDTNVALPATYGPPDLHNIADAGFPLTDGLTMRSFVMPDLAELRKAALANGTPIKILAAYRSYANQQALYAKRVGQVGNSETGSRAARPGHSEHQLGTAVDVTSAALTDVDGTWGATPTGQWIASNAYKYGFVLSYPADASKGTCSDFEPWHLRYVGRAEAAAVISAGVSLREYLYDLQLHGGSTTPSTTAATSSTTSRR